MYTQVDEKNTRPNSHHVTRRRHVKLVTAASRKLCHKRERVALGASMFQSAQATAIDSAMETCDGQHPGVCSRISAQRRHGSGRSARPRCRFLPGSRETQSEDGGMGIGSDQQKQQVCVLPRKVVQVVRGDMDGHHGFGTQSHSPHRCPLIAFASSPLDANEYPPPTPKPVTLPSQPLSPQWI